MELRQPVLTSPANPVSGLAHLHIVLIQVDQPMERDRTCTLEISQKKTTKKQEQKLHGSSKHVKIYVYQSFV